VCWVQLGDSERPLASPAAIAIPFLRDKESSTDQLDADDPGGYRRQWLLAAGPGLALALTFPPLRV
jgi:hypothetical protein